MKDNQFQKLLRVVAICMLAIGINSCSKKSSPAPEFSSSITNIISQNNIDLLRSKGMTIYSGTTPPMIEGIYSVSPFTLLSPYGSTDGWAVGKVISDYKYQLYNQQNNTLQVNYKNAALSDVGSGLATFISGSGSNFSIFYQFNGNQSGVDYVMDGVISGQLTSSGIVNFQNGFMLKSKAGDETNTIMEPVNTGRIWTDGDGLSPTTAVYKMVNNTPGSAGTGSGMAGR